MKRMLDIAKKLQINLTIIAIICLSVTAHAEPCEDCNKLHVELNKEMSMRDSYLTLKTKNEDYLKKPNVPDGAAIKVRSNLMLLGIKIETQDNKIEALKIQKKKLNDCSHCPNPKLDSKKS